MDMKVSPQKIRQLREARGWTQEHLAEVAGLSSRTVQRIEAEGNASPESRMALAAALDVEAGDLGETAAAPSGPKAPASASCHPRRDGWRRHLAMYLLICGGMLLFDFVAHGGVTWSKWPAFGWGLGLLLHWLLKRAPPGGAPAEG
ncbi:MAG: helix-turn-helix domain-containing protein [Pseudomonadota bacterium]